MPITKQQLDAVAGTLRLVTRTAGPVEPGKLVEAEVLSSLSELSVLDMIGTAALPLRVPVELQVSWSVTDHEAKAVQPGQDFVANNGLAGVLVGFVMKPPIVELTRSPVPTVSWTITASVTVKAGGLASDTKQLSVPVELVQLEIPKFVALFRHKNFAVFNDPDDPGFVVMLIPHHSILQGFSEPFNKLMDRLDDALRPLRSLVGIASFLTGLAILRQALASQPLVRVHRGSVSDLDDIHVRVDKFLGSTWLDRDLRPQDRVSSLILMGPCGTRVGCFDDEDFTTENGEWGFHVRTGPEMITVMRDLHDGKPPPTFPEEDPADGRTRRFFTVKQTGYSYADNMTSVLFDPEPTEEEARLPSPCLPVEVPDVEGPILL